jgi:hypothetical protein
LVREKTPVLFLAILAVSSPSILPSLESKLMLELNEQLARQILVLGRRSLQLIQACLLHSQYYISPSGSQPFVSTQYVLAAMAMVSDLGLNLNSVARTRSKLDSGIVKETARTWLACWYAASR